MTQELALHLMKSGKNVFLTGSPGTGKTHSIREYIRYLKEQGIPHAITAPTGIAASHLNGNTIHSFFGIGLKDKLSQYDIESLTEKKYLWDRMKKLKVLIIDEVSMLSPELFRSLDLILRTFKFSMEAFGGIQIILVGDFFQLPPIGRGSNGEKFAFQTEVWKELNLSVVSLEKSYRHSDDNLIDLLQAIRKRNILEKHINLLKSRVRNLEGEGTKLYTHNVDVDAVNKEFLSKLPSKPHFFVAKEKGAKKWRDRIFQTSLLERKLELKKDALVFFIKNNQEKGFINGTLGKVVDFDAFGIPIVETRDGRKIKAETEKWEYRDADGKTLAQVEQIPLRLAWAITIHKSQGMTLDLAEIDLRKTFALGQGYVALSRIRSLEGLYLKGFNKISLQVDPDALSFDSFVQEESKKHYSFFVQLSEKEKEDAHVDFLKRLGAIENHE